MTLSLYIPNQQKIIAQEISTRRNYFVVFYVLRRRDYSLFSLIEIELFFLVPPPFRLKFSMVAIYGSNNKIFRCCLFKFYA